MPRISPIDRRKGPGADSKSLRGRALSDANDISSSVDKQFLDMKQAIAILGVKPQTLYAYVSRGMVRTAAKGGGSASLYSREDVESVALRSRKGTPELAVGDRSMRWGAGLVLPTSISSIDNDGPKYRGLSAIDLARGSKTFEDIVELLWTGILPVHAPLWARPTIPEGFLAFANVLPGMARQSNSRRLLALVAEAYTACTGRNAELTLGAPVLAARQMIQVMAPVLGLLRTEPLYELSAKNEPLAAQLARAGGVSPGAEACEAINTCLILSADNGLSTSTFAARIAASAGADIFSCVNTALGAFEGLLTGLGCDHAELLLQKALSPNDYVKSLNLYIQREEALPGYNSPMYLEGDPRATYLLDAVRGMGVRNKPVQTLLQSVAAAEEELDAKPGLAIGLIAMCLALELPTHSAGVLMALGRSAGWVGHAFEQRLGGYMVRPKARYVGPSLL